MEQPQALPVAAHPYHHGDLRRCLIEAGCELLREGQNWDFSLREVARRAGVSHNAPYNHFADKRGLLAEVAAAGFDLLRQRLLSSMDGCRDLKKALVRTAVAYVSFGLENPAHYRLMFGPVFSTVPEGRPSPLAEAAAGARAVLENLIHRGAQTGVFAASPRKKEELQIAVLSAWSTVHGMAMLAIDGFVAAPQPVTEELIEKVARAVSAGLVRR